MVHEKKLIGYLSKEIEAHTNNLMTFRERINFAVFIGPFVLLGALLYSNKHVVGIKHWWVFLLALVVMVLSYLTMSRACARIEIQIWDQCNRWRGLIAEISKGNTERVTPDEFKFKHDVGFGYWVVYLAMTVAFGCVLVIFWQLKTV
jgi:hypothetical protein